MVLHASQQAQQHPGERVPAEGGRTAADHQQAAPSPPSVLAKAGQEGGRDRAAQQSRVRAQAGAQLLAEAHLRADQGPGLLSLGPQHRESTEQGADEHHDAAEEDLQPPLPLFTARPVLRQGRQPMEDLRQVRAARQGHPQVHQVPAPDTHLLPDDPAHGHP